MSKISYDGQKGCKKLEFFFKEEEKKEESVENKENDTVPEEKVMESDKDSKSSAEPAEEE